MGFCHFLTFFDEFFLFNVVVVLAGDVIIIVCFPKGHGSFGPLDVVVGLLFQVVILKVTVGHDVVLTKTCNLNRLTSLFLRLIGLRTLFGGCEVVVFHAYIAHDVVVGEGVLAWAEVPGFLLGIIGSLFEAFHLALKIQDVVSLLVAQSTVLQKHSV